ncbi:MAG: DUF4230 domain-containing protein [Maribacter dokdonensis]|nr:MULTISPECIES: DUF4230 domain-containing protein [Maribacter]KSA15151.1 hypothetical protein I600_1762 [Maribacter dokdonensis DSW-8]MBU2900256.1 DUF4230 domain-containing protein [Maribacter dokdonensis]PHN94524.1 DUF4230 domain-containing protein [Maribacter sp. 6B07]HAF77849.1 DUF4230 domain-containing protein [Maribacter sp.]|tara:strand:- start:55 stop:681 length:627 start_codon:yes stop_codon:yes gene_type:complete
MDNIFDTILGLVLGAIGMYWLFNFFKGKKSKEITTHQSTVLLEKMKSVCKLISVEGEFAEIYKYENVKDFMSLVSSKKKALVVIKAKAHIGYDLSKILMHADEGKKTIILDNFPQPEVLSIEPELEFYDIKSGFFNFFAPDDLTKLNAEAKSHIREKIPESGLMDTARKEALQTVLIMEKIVETIGWTLDYTALKIPQKQIELLEEKQ